MTHWDASAPLDPIVLDHPVQNISGDALDARADQLVEAIMKRLS